MTATAPHHIPRRTIARGAAWSVPVIAAAIAAPMASASLSGDVIVESGCHGLSIAGFGVTFPRFTITAVNQPIEAGSTFALTGSGLGNLTIGNINGGADLTLVNDSYVQVTITRTIQPGESANLDVTGLVSVQLLKKYTLAVENIIGNANLDKGNDIASANLTGVSLIGITLGRCTTSDAGLASQEEAQIRERIERLTPAEQETLKAEFRRAFPEAS